MKNLKNNKAITLVALIITIIVLLILAVVAISAVNGDGIISKAKVARENYQTAQNEENTTLGNYLKQIEENTSNDKPNDDIINDKVYYSIEEDKGEKYLTGYYIIDGKLIGFNSKNLVLNNDEIVELEIEEAATIDNIICINKNDKKFNEYIEIHNNLNSKYGEEFIITDSKLNNMGDYFILEVYKNEDTNEIEDIYISTFNKDLTKFWFDVDEGTEYEFSLSTNNILLDAVRNTNFYDDRK